VPRCDVRRMNLLYVEISAQSGRDMPTCAAHRRRTQPARDQPTGAAGSSLISWDPAVWRLAGTQRTASAINSAVGGPNWIGYVLRLP
jgi:hypothetical protein